MHALTLSLDLTLNLDCVPVQLLTLFLRKNPALVYAFTSSAEHSTAWHLASAAGHVHVLQLLMAATATGAQSNTHDPVSKALSIANSQVSCSEERRLWYRMLDFHVKAPWNIGSTSSQFGSHSAAS